MSDIKIGITASAEDAARQIRAMGESAKAAAPQIDALSEANAEMRSILATLVKSIDAMTEATVAGSKRQVTAQKATGKAAKESAEDISTAAAKAASTGEVLTEQIKLSARAQEFASKFGKQYADILLTTGARVSDLGKEWKAALSPAEKTAAKLAELNAFTSDAEKRTAGYATVVAELGKKLDDQVRRQDTNVGSQHKLSRSLSELTDGIKAEIVAVKDLSKNGWQKMEHAAGEANKKFAIMEDVLEGLHLPFADLVSSVKKVSAGMKDMGQSGKASTALLVGAVTAAGAAMMAVKVAGAAAAAAVSGGTLALGALVENASEAQDKLQQFGEFEMPDKQRASIDRASASVQAVGKTISAIGVQVARVFGPAIEMGATALVAFGLTAIDSMKSLSSSSGVVGKVVTFITDQMIKLVDTARTVGSFFGSKTLVKGATDIRRVLMGIQDATNGTADFGDALKDVFGADVTARARALVGQVTAVNVATREGTKAIKAQVPAYREVAVEMAQVHTDWRTFMADAPAMVYDVEGSVKALSMAADDDPFAKWATSADRFSSAASDIGRGLGDLVSFWGDATSAELADTTAKITSLEQSLSKTTDKLEQKRLNGKLKALKAQEKAELEAARRVFFIQRGLGLTSVVIDTAGAIMKALNSIGGPTNPYNIAAAAAAALAGGVQAATILSTKPPSMSGGGSGAASFSAPSTSQSAASRAVSTDTGTAKGTTAGADTGTLTTSGRYAVPLTDGYLPPTSGAQMLKLSPGDSASVKRAGAVSRDDGKQAGLLAEIVSELKRQSRQLSDLSAQLLKKQHYASVASPAGMR